MTRLPNLTLSKGSRRGIAAGALAASLIAPTQASAFFQQTSLEGTLGTDIGGVWLSVQNIMPEFRIQYPKPASGPAIPIEVGPIPAELQSLLGDKPTGVVVTKCIDTQFCSDQGLLVGDVVMDINTRPTPDVAAFNEAVANTPPSILISIRRTALKMTTARLLKIKYSGGQSGSENAGESLDIRVLDVTLPFDKQIDESRVNHTAVVPATADFDAITEGWAELPLQSPLRYATGKHRFVAQGSFDESLSGDKSLTNSKFAIVMDLTSNPVRGGGGQVIDVYGIEQLDSKKMSGNYVSVTIANAPFPINIEFKGRFEMTRLTDWSDQDDKNRAAAEAAKPKEDMEKYKTLPDVPAPAKP
jgi:hypothetical protein